MTPMQKADLAKEKRRLYYLNVVWPKNQAAKQLKQESLEAKKKMELIRGPIKPLVTPARDCQSPFDCDNCAYEQYDDMCRSCFEMSLR